MKQGIWSVSVLDQQITMPDNLVFIHDLNGQVIQSWDMLGPDRKVLQTLFTGIYSPWPRVGEP